MTGPVIVPLDGSQFAEHAVPFGASLAERLGTDLLLLRLAPIAEAALALPAGKTITVEAQEASLCAYADAYLGDVAKQVKALGVPARSLALAERAAEGIARVADEQEAVCIVMSTHGQRGITRWALGSVTDRVLHLTRRPLMILPPRTPVPALSTPLPQLRRILVPLDGSPLAETALVEARRLAQAYHADLLLFRTQLPFMELSSQAMFPLLEGEAWEAQLVEAREYLRRIQSSLQAEGIQAAYELGTEPPAEAILDFARQAEADLIVMATHAREGVRRTFLGSVTDRIARSGQIPVLAIRPLGGH